VIFSSVAFVNNAAKGGNGASAGAGGGGAGGGLGSAGGIGSSNEPLPRPRTIFMTLAMPVQSPLWGSKASKRI